MKTVDIERLTILSYKFNRDVSEIDIFNWLCNFEEADWELALTVLDGVQYFSDERCAEILRNGLYEITDGNVPTWIVPIGEIGKSGTMVAYYTNKIIDKKHGENIQIFQKGDDFIKIGQNANVLLLDDFMGSGKTAVEFYNSIKDRIPQGCKLYALTVAYMPVAQHKLEMEGIQVFGVCHPRAFTKRWSLFGTGDRMKKIKDFCLKYGEKLYKVKTDYKVEGDKRGYIGPLGFMNSQALVCFGHTSPNNTLPILWANGNKGTKWIPLFPRNICARISRQDTFERRKYYWLSLTSKLKIKYHIFNGFDYSVESVRLMALIYLKSRRKSDIYICRYLDLTYDELRDLLSIAVAKGILDNSGSLTKDTVSLYCELRRHDSLSLSSHEKYAEDANEIYVPKRFGGIN